MLQSFLLFLAVMGIGLLGIAFIISVKIKDLTDLNPNLNYSQVAKLFMSKATASYIISIIGLLAYAILRKEIMGIFVSGDSDSIMNRLLKAQLFGGFAIGAGLQWGIYKVGFRKLDNIMKIWCGDAKTGGPDENTKLITPNNDGTIPKVEQPVQQDGPTGPQ